MTPRVARDLMAQPYRDTAIAFFGTSSFIGVIRNARILRRLIAAGIRPAVVVTAPDVPERRGQELLSAAVKSAALEFGLTVLQPKTLQGFAAELRAQRIELSIVAAYGKILPREVLAVPKFGSLNIHPSLLPRWRGTSPIQATILAGDSMTGITIIRMNEKIDHGPIIAKSEFPLDGRAWTAPELSDALADRGVDLLRQTIEPWMAGEITPQPQDDAAATYAPLLRREDGHIDWTQPATHIVRMVRALQPWPTAFTFWQRGGDRLRLQVLAAEVFSGDAPDTPYRSAPGGVAERQGRLLVVTATAALEIVRLKLEGGAEMNADAFLRGHRALVGSVLA